MAEKHRNLPPRPVHIPPERRLTATYYSAEESQLAIQGKAIPQGLGRQVTQACVVRGIRSHPGFATELHGTLPIFLCALNARQIMSDVVPDMNQPEEFPYCLWYPNIAKKTTYRELVARYPCMKYQVDRACAVAGYTQLYRELVLLPDVSIAEEARDNESQDIFEDIMAHKEKFAVMNDYTRTINTDSTSLPPTYLNGDTAVRSSLDTKRKFRRNPPLDLRDCHFNITEDFCFDTIDFVPEAVKKAKSLAVKHLYTPLPIDLPPLDKDILILIAAYMGDVDRYSRLRRHEKFLYQEYYCVIRGIYHNTFFAKWWSIRFQTGEDDPEKCTKIMRAVTARAIMNNDLSRISSSTLRMSIPYCIWYPTVPRESTLELLVARRPDMAPQVARVCIVANYKDLYDQLDPIPDSDLLAEATASPHCHYTMALRRKLNGASGVDDHIAAGLVEGWKRYTRAHALEHTAGDLKAEVGPWDVVVGFPWLYDGDDANISGIG